METSDVRRLKELEEENSRLKKINFTQQRFGLTQHGIPAQQKALAVVGNWPDPEISKENH